MPKNPYDAGHYSFLETIKVLHKTAGPDFAAESLLQTGMSAAENAEPVDFDTVEEFVASMDSLDNPISQFEGRARHYGGGLFGLPACPFSAPIKNYVAAAGQLPQEYEAVTNAMNKPSEATTRLRVGQGAAVSPFCAMHQPVRSKLGDLIRVAGKALRVYQLGCKSSSGKKAIADRWVKACGLTRERVDEILEDNMCCYCIRFEDDSGL